jgi:SAM-dependent methyltransferase
MIQLYSTLATVYHEMYQQIFDYDKEFRWYDSVLKKNHCHKIVEIGCGTGLLAKRLIGAGYDYTGIDLYPEMIEIARKETNCDRFMQGDMRDLKIGGLFDSALITGRSIAYVIRDPEIRSTFEGIRKILKDQAIFVFDVFDAEKIFGNFTEESEQVIFSGNRKITRKNRLVKNLATGWTWDFHAKYSIEEEGTTNEYDDLSTLRAFTKEEITSFLEISGFKPLEIITENVMMIIAEKAGSV